MKKLILAAVFFSIPIIGVVAMNPSAAQQQFEQGMKWAQKTFPAPEQKPKKIVRRG